MKKFRAWGDSKPGLVSVQVAAMFSTVTEKCTIKKYKRRCNMDEVRLHIVITCLCTLYKGGFFPP